MKYELKGTYKFMLAIIFAVLFATTGIQFFINNKINDARNAMIMNYLPFLMMMFMLIIFGALIAATIFIINSYRKELYEDRGYLTFTLPLTGRQFLGSKLVVALFWYIAIAIALVIYNGILGTILFGNGWITQLFRVFNDYDFGIIAINAFSLFFDYVK
jgi:ABC-type transport system involved in multi-copper enzyme maturation permease subunit